MFTCFNALKILVMGGSRFVGRSLVEKLKRENHEIYLFTRGLTPLPENVHHIKGDRKSDDLSKLKGLKFDVVVDSSGRQVEDSKRVLDQTGVPDDRFIYISSAGIYSANQEFPLDELSPIDPNSRHIGKSNTENWLIKEGIPFTSFRPTYIYGPNNYNPIERWFFDRITYSRPIPIPGDGETITQLGHVEDLADAILISMSKKISINKCYNCSGSRGITFNGLVQLAAEASGRSIASLKFHYFDACKLDPKARKVFPLRLKHFCTDIGLIEKDLGWKPKFSLKEGLIDSYQNDYLKKPTNDPDFSMDDKLISNSCN